MSGMLVMGIMACSTTSDSGEDDFGPPEDDTVIEAEMAFTRASYPNASDTRKFYMHGINNGTKAWVIRNVEYTKNKKTGIWKGSKAISWPEVPITLSFYVVNPSFDIFDQTKSVIEYSKVNMVYNIPENASSQEDILYASMLNQDQNTNSKKVKFTFKHGLSYQRFKGQNSLGDKYEVIIKSITFCNIETTGTMKYNQKTDNKISWTVSTDEPYKTSTIDFVDGSGNVGVKLPTVADYLSVDDYLLTIPQKNDLWKTAGKDDNHVSISDADTQKLHYWRIEAKIIDTQETEATDDDTYLLGNANNDDPEKPEWGTVYMQPVAKEWKLGNTYLNTVGFTSSSLFNEEGINFFDALKSGGAEGIEILGANNINTVITTEEWGYEEDELDLQLDTDAENN